MRRTALLLCLCLVSCKGGGDNGPDLPTGPSGPTPAVTNPVINRFNVPSGGVFEIWATHMRPARNGVLADSVELYDAYRNTSNERLYVATDFVLEEGHSQPRQGVSSISFLVHGPNTASSPTGMSGRFEPVRGDMTYWRIRIWILRADEDRNSDLIREGARPPDGVLYDRFGWRR